MIIEKINDTFRSDDRSVNRFGNYFENTGLSGRLRARQMCYHVIDNSSIICYLWLTDNEPRMATALFDIKNPIIFKTFSKFDDVEAYQYMAYNRHNKSDRVRLHMTRKINSWLYFNISFEKTGLPDILFINGMNDSLFSKIDSTLGYNWDYKRGLTGHMLWFNIDHKYYYCFQPEGKPLSEQVFYRMILEFLYLLCIPFSVRPKRR